MKMLRTRQGYLQIKDSGKYLEDTQWIDEPK